MKSFPSTLNTGGYNIHTSSSNVNSSIKEIALNSFKNAFYNANSKAVTRNKWEIDKLNFNFVNDKKIALQKLNIINESANVIYANKAMPNSGNSFAEEEKDNSFISYVENPVKMPLAALEQMNQFKYIYNVTFSTDTETVLQIPEDIKLANNQQLKDANPTQLEASVNTMNFFLDSAVSPSLFNWRNGVHVAGMMENIPLMDSLVAFDGNEDVVQPARDKDGNLTYEKVNIGFNNIKFDPWVGDCSIRELVELSRKPNSILGYAIYKYADFMYCKDVGKVSNNHMITLRKFAHPVPDNIFKGAKVRGGFEEAQPDIARMICYFGTGDNKLEDILKYTVKASWKPLNAAIQEQPSRADSNNGLAAPIINALNPGYFNRYLQGAAGANNAMDVLGHRYLGSWFQKVGNLMGNSNYSGFNCGQYAQDSVFYGSQSTDANRIWTPKNTIQSTYVYEGKLTCTHEITLVFSYKLASYAGINPKSAFLDLLANVLEMTYRNGRFWGGSRKLIGPPDSSSGYKKAHDMVDKFWDKASGIIDGLLTGGLSWGDLANKAMDAVNSLVGKATNMVNGLDEEGQRRGAKSGGFVDTIKSILLGFKHSPAGQKLGMAAKAMLKNQIGRPNLYAWNSLLSGAPVGQWHLTVGNPKNPIMAMGNLIMDSATIQHLGPLGIDDFPTELKVTVTLKPGRDRDSGEIKRMYTKGAGSIYVKKGGNRLKDILNTAFLNKLGEIYASGDIYEVDNKGNYTGTRANSTGYYEGKDAWDIDDPARVTAKIEHDNTEIKNDLEKIRKTTPTTTTTKKP